MFLYCMNILICDDKKEDALQLKELIGASLPKARIIIFNTPADVLAHIDAGDSAVDACFLDIIMPGMDGVSLAVKLRKKGYGGQIVFLTSSNDFAAQSYEVKAFSYLLKPPDKTTVANVLRELEIARQAADTASLRVKTKTTSMFILFKNISHIEVIGRVVYFRLTNGDEIAANTRFLDVAPVLLADKRFAQCHRSFVVNLHDIYKVQGNYAIMNSGAKIPISKNFADFKNLYIDYMFADANIGGR